MSGEHTWREARAVVRWSSIAMLAGAGLLAGCFVGSTDHTSRGSAGGGPYATSSSSSGGGTQSQPLLVDVDTGGTLVTTPGNGIGVYIEYVSGGHWSVSWTCDTALTSLSCSYIVDASVSTGTLVETGNSVEPNDSVSQATPRQIEAVTTTTTGVDGVLFDAAPGAAITVSVSLNAPVSFFFVQDNQVNGGYQGTLTNPLMFQPSTP
jgi:hypothetical protein